MFQLGSRRPAFSVLMLAGGHPPQPRVRINLDFVDELELQISPDRVWGSSESERERERGRENERTRGRDDGDSDNEISRDELLHEPQRGGGEGFGRENAFQPQDRKHQRKVRLTHPNRSG